MCNVLIPEVCVGSSPCQSSVPKPLPLQRLAFMQVWTLCDKAWFIGDHATSRCVETMVRNVWWPVTCWILSTMWTQRAETIACVCIQVISAELWQRIDGNMLDTTC